jgi:pseudouridine-5'-phosphate glycosidase
LNPVSVVTENSSSIIVHITKLISRPNKQRECDHTEDLPFTLKKMYHKANRRTMETQIFLQHNNIISEKSSKKETKTLQDVITI